MLSAYSTTHHRAVQHCLHPSTPPLSMFLDEEEEDQLEMNKLDLCPLEA